MVRSEVSADLQVHLIIVGNHRVVRPRGWGSWRRLGRQKYLPAVIGHLQLVQVESRKIIHEVTLDLAAEDEDLGAEDVERMTVAP